MDNDIRQLQRSFQLAPSPDGALRLIHARRRLGQDVLHVADLRQFYDLSKSSSELRKELISYAVAGKLKLSPIHLKRMGIRVLNLMGGYVQRALRENTAASKFFVHSQYSKSCDHQHSTFANAQKCAKRIEIGRAHV